MVFCSYNDIIGDYYYRICIGKIKNNSVLFRRLEAFKNHFVYYIFSLFYFRLYSFVYGIQFLFYSMFENYILKFMRNINYLKQFFLLNLIFAVLVLVFLFKVYAGIEQAMFYIALSGFIGSFFIKENSFNRYLKLIFFNALFFGFLLSLIFMIYVFINNGPDEALSIYQFLFLIFPISLYGLLIGLCNFFGGLAGIIPKGFIERLKI